MRIRLNDAVKGQHKGKEKTEQDARDLGRGAHRCNRLPDGGVVDGKENPKEEVRVSAPVCWKTDGPVPAEKEERRSQNVPGDFYQDLRRNERGP